MSRRYQNLPFIQKVIVTSMLILFTYLIIQAFNKLGFLNRYWMGILLNVCINVIMVVSLNITTGFLGQLTLGHAGFMAVGAYFSAFTSKTLLVSLPLDIAFVISLILGGLLALVFGAIVCIPTLRLKGDYLAIITLAFGEVIKNILLNLDIIGGAKGYFGISRTSTFTIAYIFAVITIVVSYSLFKTRQGRAIISVREDEIAAEASGVNTDNYKMLAFIIAAFFAGIGGGLYAHNMGILEPKVFKLDKSIEFLVMVVLGGMGSLKGSVIAATVLTILPELLRSVSEFRMLFYALALILMMLYRYDDRLQPFRSKLLTLFKRRKE